VNDDVKDPAHEAPIVDEDASADGRSEHGSEKTHHEEQHEGHGKKHDDHGGHGGGHGGSWIVTYCDMITLLIAFFICILTFASQENGKGSQRRMRDSVLYGLDGTGIAGPVTRPGVADEFMWRQVVLASNPARRGSPMPPLYSDPSMDIVPRVLAMLEESSDQSLEDSYAMTVPLAFLFGTDKKLTKSGKQLLKAAANNLRTLPFDILMQVDTRIGLPVAVTMAQYLIREEDLNPSQVAFGTIDNAGHGEKTVRFVFLRRR
jgi:chemotaxis protein MotB